MQRKAKILVVDDDVDLVESIKAVLEKKAYQVVTAHNGEDGLKKVVEERPNLIILDVIMPVMDGFTACKELKQNPHYHFFSKIPVLMLTVFPKGIEETNIPLSAGVTMEADDYLQKPLQPEELLKRVEQLLKQYS